MVMRRAIDSLRRRDWASVVVEILVVVVGVFVGLQASNWNEDRETDKRAAIFSQHLKSDLRAEAWGYEMQIGYYRTVLANGRQAADGLTGKSPLSDAALLVAAYRATQYNDNIRRRSTYDELTSTGEIGLIRDEAMRDIAMRVYNFPVLGSIVNEAEHSEYRHWFRLNIPHGVQQALSEGCGDHAAIVGDYRSISTVLDYPCSVPLSADEIAGAASILRSDKSALPLLRLRIADVQTGLENLTKYNEDIREDLRAVAKEKQ